MVTGVLLVVSTWLLALSLLASVGSAIGLLGAEDRLAAIRQSLWWGIAIATVLVLAISLFFPLSEPVGLLGIIAVGFVSAGLRLASWLHLPTGLSRPRPRECLAIGILVVATLYIALAALGPVTNYDSGLYHLGALRYQQEEGLVPGIANLYFPLGYGNSVITWSAFLGSTPWGSNGFRLFNGLLLALLAAETVLRLMHRLRTPGTYVLLLALLFVWVPMVSLSDYWVTSPTSDSSVLILTTVSVAYLADAVYQGRHAQQSLANLGVAVVLGWVLVSMRPTMVVFAVSVFGVAILLTLGRQSQGSESKNKMLRGIAAGTLAVGLALGLIQALRDRMLSGWLQYPLSLFAFDVDWRAPDPTEVRTATLGAARDPGNLWVAADSWGWIPGWIGRLPSQWEFWLCVLLTLASAVLVYVSYRTAGDFPARSAALSAIPSALAILAWFVASPPAFRFIWGPLFTLAVIPGAFAAATLVRRPRSSVIQVHRFIPAMLGLSLLGVVAFSAVTRFEYEEVTSARAFVAGPVSIPYTVARLPTPEVSEAVLASGLTVTFPLESDQCWAEYPLCTAQLLESVATLGETWQEGFRH